MGKWGGRIQAALQRGRVATSLQDHVESRHTEITGEPAVIGGTLESATWDVGESNPQPEPQLHCRQSEINHPP